MKKLSNTIYLEYEELTAAGISLNTIKAAVKRGAWLSVKDPADKRRTLVSFPDLPTRYAKKVTARWGSPHTWSCEATTPQPSPEVALATLSAAIQASPAHYTALLRRYPQQQAAAWARTAACLALLASRHSRAELIALGVASKEELLTTVMQLMQQEGLPGACSNARVLRRKVSAWASQGIDSLTDGRIGNTNAAKLLDEEQKNTLLALMSSPQKPSIQVVTYLYNRQASQQGWPILSESTARRFLHEPANRQTWTLARHGLDTHRSLYNINVRRSGPQAPNVMWVLDGTPLELFYQTRTTRWNATTRRHESRITRHNRLESILVIDAHSWRVLGWELCATESAASLHAALKLAVQRTGALPLELQHDNSSAAKAQAALFQSLAHWNTSTRPYNGKSKIIENFFNHFQSMVLRYFPSWAGQGITTRSLDSHPNPDHLQQQELPSLQDVQTHFLEAVSIWNHLATEGRQAPEALYHATPSAGQAIDTLGQVSLFWERRDRLYTYRADGITLELDGQRHIFQVLDTKFQLQSVGKKFQIAFDRDCLDYIYLYQNDRPVLDSAGEPLMATAIELVPMSRAEHTPDTLRTLGRRLSFKDTVEELTAERVLRIQQYASDYDLKADYRTVFKDELNAAETLAKGSLYSATHDEDGIGRRLRTMYLDDEA